MPVKSADPRSAGPGEQYARYCNQTALPEAPIRIGDIDA
jgi:hypothetical protein